MTDHPASGLGEEKEPPIDATVVDIDSLRKQAMPETIDKYRVKRLIGSGGMGTVYLAQQDNPRRDVAIKVMNPGVVSHKAMRRFEFEAQILARLHHQAIAQVYEAGTYDDGSGPRPFFAMEYVSSAKELGDYVSRKKLDVKDRLELFRAVCEGVEYGHRRGVIHRDLKPSNILVNVDGYPKIIDFGVARSTDSDAVSATLATEAGKLIGTLQYMSPEQIELDPSDLDTRSDVYTLGVMLYELLVGKVPYDVTQTTITRAAELIRDTQPARLREIDAALKGDLETICLKALEKDRDQRYQSAGDLSEDIRRYLADEPILAKPPTKSEQLRRFVRKNKAAALATAVVALALVVATVVSIVFAVEASRQRNAADKALAEAEAKTKELQTVADFQVKQLSGIDVAAVGASLRMSMIRKLNLEPKEALGVDFTGSALQLLNKHIFDRTQTMVDEELAGQPLIQAQLLQAMATSLWNLGLLEEASAPQIRALELRVAELGREDPTTLESIGAMGNLIRIQGRYEDAAPYLTECLETRRRILGDEDPATLRSINDLGILLYYQGKYEEAMEYYSEALEARRRILGDEHRATLHSINNMANLFERQGKYDEAFVLHTEAYETRRRTMGSQHPSTLVSMRNIGNVLENQGKQDEAMPYYKEVLDVYRRTLGNEHHATVGAMMGIAGVYERQGRYEDSVLYMKEASEIYRRTLGDEHPSTISAVGNVGLLLQRQGKYGEAMPYMLEGLETRRQTLGDEHPSTLWAMNAMGMLLTSQGKYEEAMQFQVDALEKRTRTLGKAHPTTLWSRIFIGEILILQGRYDEAERTFTEVLDEFHQMGGDDREGALVSMAGIGTALEGQGRYAEAMPYMERSIAGLRKTLGERNPKLIRPIHNMGVLLKSQGKYEEAMVHFKEALAISRREQGSEHPDAFRTIGQQGILLSSQGKFEEALPYMSESLDGHTSMLGASHPHTIESLEAMVEFHDAWHEAEPDGGHDATAAEYRELLKEPTANAEPSVP